MEWGETNYFLNDGTKFRHAEHDGFRKSTAMDTRPGDITDGLSQTVAMSERLVKLNNTLAPRPTVEEMLQKPKRTFWWTEVAYRRSGEEAAAIDQCRQHRTTVLPQMFGANAPNLRMGRPSYDHMLPPNHPGCYNGPEDFDVNFEAFLIPASSLHPGGVNSLMADGSVHFVNESIDAGVWQALGTRNGRESFNSPFGR
jgi:prepilin-type processing-associated H-X9-DG protein